MIAVGLPAAQVARRLNGKRVVFCRVFNYEEAGLVSPTMKASAPCRRWRSRSACGS
ncbi:MAG: hypothetical protein MZV65_33555 [Chromatiales bacterium]|nr:hypothetical protein [Chromatiales bacterium]